MRRLWIVATALLLIGSGGCVARTAATIVTAPVKVASKTIDWTTTSQSEADRNAGRKMRKQQERDRRAAEKAERDCRRQGGSDCDHYAYRGGSAVPE